MEHGIMEFTSEEKGKCVISKSWNVSLAGQRECTFPTAVCRYVS